MSQRKRHIAAKRILLNNGVKFVCVMCGKPENKQNRLSKLTIDFIVPHYCFGKCELSNLQFLCVRHHRIKTRKDSEKIKTIHKRGSTNHLEEMKKLGYIV